MVTRILIAASAILMIAVFFYPLWQISLTAPQYPEGLAIQIYIDRITGDLRNINVLNHYIGMSKIQPEKLRELTIFPYAFGFLSGFGILCAILNRRMLNGIWSAAVLLFAVCSLYDFYAWEYDFGHNLSDDAPMKLEDSYQPPLIGEKQLANITARSWPMSAGYAFSASTTIATLIFILSVFPRKPSH